MDRERLMNNNIDIDIITISYGSISYKIEFCHIYPFVVLILLMVLYFLLNLFGYGISTLLLLL